MTVKTILLTCATVGLVAAACSSTDERALWEARRERVDDVAHIVIFWLKSPGDAEGRRRIIEASSGFRGIPGVVNVEAGEVLPSPRPNVDKSFDVAVVMWFADRDALEAYQVHPKHKAMLQEVGPLVERTVVYDFTRGELRSKDQGTR